MNEYDELFYQGMSEAEINSEEIDMGEERTPYDEPDDEDSDLFIDDDDWDDNEPAYPFDDDTYGDDDDDF